MNPFATTPREAIVLATGIFVGAIVFFVAIL